MYASASPSGEWLGAANDAVARAGGKIGPPSLKKSFDREKCHPSSRGLRCFFSLADFAYVTISRPCKYVTIAQHAGVFTLHRPVVTLHGVTLFHSAPPFHENRKIKKGGRGRRYEPGNKKEKRKKKEKERKN